MSVISLGTVGSLVFFKTLTTDCSKAVTSYLNRATLKKKNKHNRNGSLIHEHANGEETTKQYAL